MLGLFSLQRLTDVRLNSDVSFHRLYRRRLISGVCSDRCEAHRLTDVFEFFPVTVKAPHQTLSVHSLKKSSFFSC